VVDKSRQSTGLPSATLFRQFLILAVVGLILHVRCVFSHKYRRMTPEISEISNAANCGATVFPSPLQGAHYAEIRQAVNF